MLRKKSKSIDNTRRNPAEKRASFSVATDETTRGTGSIKISAPAPDDTIEVYFGFLQVYHKLFYICLFKQSK